MSGCKFCARVRRWFGIKAGVDCDARWREQWLLSSDWDRDASNYDELWWSDSDRNRALLEEAFSRCDADPEAAFRLRLEAAEAGSANAMESVALHYDTGIGVAADFDKAADYCRRAICAGSWSATISHARLLADHGHFDECEEVLQSGVQLDFIPAFFWLAWIRYDRAPTRATCRAVRLLLDHAAEQGHPGAKLTLARWMAQGKFGLRAIPQGLRQMTKLMPPPWMESDAAPADSPKAPPLKPAAQE